MSKSGFDEAAFLSAIANGVHALSPRGTARSGFSLAFLDWAPGVVLKATVTSLNTDGEIVAEHINKGTRRKVAFSPRDLLALSVEREIETEAEVEWWALADDVAAAVEEAASNGV